MKEAYDQLERKDIIDSGKVEIIRRYIRSKFPHLSQAEQGGIFADAVHKLIDGNISQFGENHRKRIKESVFKKAALKSVFNINAAEIFSSALALKDYGNDYFDSLENWVASNQDTKVTRDELMKLAEKLMEISVEELEAKLSEIIEVVDEQIIIENRIANIATSMGITNKTSSLDINETEKENEATSKQGTKLPKMQSKKLFVEKDIFNETEADENIDLDKEIIEVLSEPKSKEEISVLANKEEFEEKKPMIIPGNEEIEIFTRKNADKFFMAVGEKKKRKKIDLNIIGSIKDAISTLLSMIPVKKTSLREVLLQLILLLVLISVTGLVYIYFEGSKQVVSVPRRLIEGTQIADPYKDIMDLYFTKESRSLRK